jgi:signal transduction histidine kinase/ligand-binding sensor domain-containing protein/CheY-like chemotaxis protein
MPRLITCTVFARLALPVFISLPFVSSKAQEKVPVFEHIGLEQGLPQGQILGLLQDHYGFIWFGTMTGLVRYDGYNFVRFVHDPSDPTTLSHSTAKMPIEDKQGNIWSGGPYGLNRWDRGTNCFQRFFHDPSAPNSLPDNAVEVIFEDSQGWIWIGTARGIAWYDGKDIHRATIAGHSTVENGFQANSFAENADGNILAGMVHGLAKINRRTGKGILYPLPCSSECNPLPVVNRIYKDREGNFWAGTNKGLFCWDSKTDIFSKIPLPGTIVQQAVRNMIEDNEGVLWLSTLNDNGLFRLNPRTGRVDHVKHSPANSFGLSSNHVRDFLLDRLGYLWIGTYNGLNKLNLNPPRFTFLQQEPGDMRPENLAFRAHLDAWGGMWFSTYGQKVFYAKKTGEKALEMTSLPFKTYPVEVDNFMSTAEGEVWIAPDPNGVIRYHIGSGRSSWLDGLYSTNDSLEVLPIFYMEEDQGQPNFVWFSSRSGLCRFSKKTKEHVYFPPKKDLPALKDNLIVNGLQVGDNHIYVLFESHFNGKVGRFDKKTGRYRFIKTSNVFPDGKSTLHVRQFAHTPDGIVWMATSNGLGRFDPGNEAFTLLASREGNNFMGIATDGRGMVWLKSIQHLYRYDPRTGIFWQFNLTKDMKEFNSVGTSAGPDGRILFHGNNGFYLFHPDSVRLDTTLPRVVLTDFKVLNHSQHFGTSPELLQNITLHYQENVFTFEYAALHFGDTKNNRYRYRLEGFDKLWVEAGAERKVTYTDLDAGQYFFKVMASNADGVWHSTPLVVRLNILPPPWRTWWAYIVYLVLLIAAVYAFYSYKKRQWQMRSQLDMEHREAERLKELDTVKTRLYTNITHEFRTPLTVILGMVKQIRANPKDWYSEGLQMIERNGQNLLRLVQQMLDLSKLESGKLTLCYRRGDVVVFLKYLLESFHSMAESKGVKLHFLSDFETFSMDFDPERLQQVVSNLMSNALKFTPAEGNIYFFVEGDTPNHEQLIFIIRDTGSGISQEHLPHIFDRFYQADHGEPTGGTGIGLTLTKELVHLMDGQITVKSKPGQGTEFTVVLPVITLSTTTWLPDDLPSPIRHTVTTPAPPKPLSTSNQPLLLIAEDNADVIVYLTGFLASKYRLITVPDGRACVDAAVETTPDIIVSDVMMPQMNGFQVCEALKKDERTSHIPIILLTAKADMESKMEGLRRRADAYLAKPFYEEELLQRIENLLDLRKSLQKFYLSSAGLTNEANALRPAPEVDFMEDYFVKKVKNAVEAHLDDVNFTVEYLCTIVCLSHSQFHRKLSALTGHSATTFIRYIRLNKAKELLKNPELTITAIAFDTGFSDPSYFARVFKQEFGVSPADWRLQQTHTSH